MTAMEKKDKTLNVPNLRFPEFSGEWEKELLGTTCNVLMCKRILASQTNAECGVPFYKIGTIGGIPDAYISKELFESYRAKYNYPRKGEVMITCAGTVGKAMIFDGEDSYYQDSNIVWIDNPTNKIDNTFLYHFISKVDWSKLNTTTIVRIYNDDLRQLRISYPTLSEQRKISIFLNLLNQRIETQKKIIEKYESLIRGLITDVNKGKTCKCKAVALRDVLIEVHEKNVENHEVCSVSVRQGVINQIDYLGRSFAAKEVLHYNVVNYGDIVYTKSPTGEFPYGIVKRSNLDRPVAVSPLYGVYRPVNDYVGIYLHLYFKSPVNTKNYLHRLIQKGAKNTINITNQHFLDNEILIPENGWLEIIVNAASTIEKMIHIECNALLCLEKQKNYLLSKMFI